MSPSEVATPHVVTIWLDEDGRVVPRCLKCKGSGRCVTCKGLAQSAVCASSGTAKHPGCAGSGACACRECAGSGDCNACDGKVFYEDEATKTFAIIRGVDVTRRIVFECESRAQRALAVLNSLPPQQVEAMFNRAA